MSEQIKPVICSLQNPLAALRGVNRGMPLHCELEAGDTGKSIELHLVIDEAEKGYLLQAQCLPAEPQSRFLPEALVEIWQEGSLIATTTVDTFYTFRFRIEHLQPIVIRITDQKSLIFKAKILFEV